MPAGDLVLVLLQVLLLPYVPLFIHKGRELKEEAFQLAH